MSRKFCKQELEDEFRLPNLSSEILEVKKRIQLSEGQRKALFEEIANESRRDADEILRLRKEIAHVQVGIHERRSNLLGGLLPTISSAPCKRVTQPAGAAAEGAPRVRTAPPKRVHDERAVKKLLTAASAKSLRHVAEYLDLQQIDKLKSFGLLAYQCKQKQGKLKGLTVQYQRLLIAKDRKDAADEVSAANALLAKEYRSRINAVQVQIREAEHVRSRYKDIRWKMREDAARFESKLAEIELELRQQQFDIDKVQQVNKEALKLRASARSALQKEERQVLVASAARERQSVEGRRLVEARQADLAYLEKHFNQKKPAGEQQAFNADDADVLRPEQGAAFDPLEELKVDIGMLIEATGSSCIAEVLAKVKGQTTTQVRLMALRKTKESAKSATQRRLDAMVEELERLRFADGRSNQENADGVEEARRKLRSEQDAKAEIDGKLQHVRGVTQKIVDKLLNTCLCMYKEDASDGPATALQMIAKINDGIRALRLNALTPHATVEQLLEELDESDGDLLPEPYHDIIRRTPVPNSGAPTPVATQSAAAASDDEEELPTRNYLKRQAQLVVDAKNKRKTMRFPIPKAK